jgi:ParB family chromosome partitioning protein
MAQQYGLGRGLASLIPPKKENSKEEQREGTKRVVASGSFEPRSAQLPIMSDGPSNSQEKGSVREISVHAIVPNPHQPRLHFDEEKLLELAASIKEHGILQPLVVTQVDDKNYELIAGERRFQAAKKAGLTVVPVLVRVAGEQLKLELAIIENVQRHNLNPIEEAKAYARLVNEFSLSQEQVATKMGKKRSSIANTLRLLHLPVEIQRAVSTGKITEGHAKALLAIENKEKQRAIFDLILKEELTVRETESRVRSVTVNGHTRVIKNLSPEVAALTQTLAEQFGTKVQITATGNKDNQRGKIIFEYFSEEELKGLIKKLQED